MKLRKFEIKDVEASLRNKQLQRVQILVKEVIQEGVARGYGDLEALRLQVINQPMIHKKTLLMFAIEYSSGKEILEFLLDSGADLESRDRWGNTAIVYAARSKTIESIFVLHSRGISLEGLWEKGKTVLMIAAENGHLEMVEFLLERGLDPDLCRSADAPKVHMMTALGFAVQNGHEIIIDYLLASGAEMNKGKPSPLVKAIERRDVDCTVKLINAGCNLPSDPAGLMNLLSAESKIHELDAKAQLFNNLMYHDRFTEALAYSIGKKNLLWVYNLLVKEGAKLGDLMPSEHQALKVLLLSGKGLNTDKLVECAMAIGDRELLKELWYKASPAQQERIAKLVDGEDFVLAAKTKEKFSALMKDAPRGEVAKYWPSNFGVLDSREYALSVLDKAPAIDWRARDLKNLGVLVDVLKSDDSVANKVKHISKISDEICRDLKTSLRAKYKELKILDFALLEDLNYLFIREKLSEKDIAVFIGNLQFAIERIIYIEANPVNATKPKKPKVVGGGGGGSSESKGGEDESKGAEDEDGDAPEPTKDPKVEREELLKELRDKMLPHHKTLYKIRDEEISKEFFPRLSLLRDKIGIIDSDKFDSAGRVKICYMIARIGECANILAASRKFTGDDSIAKDKLSEIFNFLGGCRNYVKAGYAEIVIGKDEGFLAMFARLIKVLPDSLADWHVLEVTLPIYPVSEAYNINASREAKTLAQVIQSETLDSDILSMILNGLGVYLHGLKDSNITSIAIARQAMLGDDSKLKEYIADIIEVRNQLMHVSFIGDELLQQAKKSAEGATANMAEICNIYLVEQYKSGKLITQSILPEARAKYFLAGSDDVTQALLFVRGVIELGQEYALLSEEFKFEGGSHGVESFFQYMFHGSHIIPLKVEAAIIASKLKGPQVRYFELEEERIKGEVGLATGALVTEYASLMGKFTEMVEETLPELGDY